LNSTLEIIYNGRDLIKEKSFIRINVEKLEAIYSETIQADTSFYNRTSSDISLEGSGYLTGFPLHIIDKEEDNNKYFRKINFLIKPRKNIELYNELETTNGRIYYFNEEDQVMNEPEINVEATQIVINKIISQFKTSETKMEIGFYITAFVDKIISKYESNLENYIEINTFKHNAVLANLATRRILTEKKQDKENINIKASHDN
jgi:hypothetical protein